MKRLFVIVLLTGVGTHYAAQDKASGLDAGQRDSAQLEQLGKALEARKPLERAAQNLQDPLESHHESIKQSSEKQKEAKVGERSRFGN